MEKSTRKTNFERYIKVIISLIQLGLTILVNFLSDSPQMLMLPCLFILLFCVFTIGINIKNVLKKEGRENVCLGIIAMQTILGIFVFYLLFLNKL